MGQDTYKGLASFMGLPPWLYHLHGSTSMGLPPWLYHLHGSTSMDLPTWVYLHGSTYMGLPPWVYLHGSTYMGLPPWGYPPPWVYPSTQGWLVRPSGSSAAPLVGMFSLGAGVPLPHIVSGRLRAINHPVKHRQLYSAVC